MSYEWPNPIDLIRPPPLILDACQPTARDSCGKTQACVERDRSLATREGGGAYGGTCPFCNCGKKSWLIKSHALSVKLSLIIL